MTERIEDQADDEEAREARIIALAVEQWHEDGKIEIDEDGTWEEHDDNGRAHLVSFPVVSEGDDNGAYVRAWVWVDFRGTDLDKGGEDDG